MVSANKYNFYALAVNKLMKYTFFIVLIFYNKSDFKDLKRQFRLFANIHRFCLYEHYSSSFLYEFSQ